MYKFKKEYINVDVEFGNPLGIKINTSTINPNDPFFIKNYPFLFTECPCKDVCVCEVVKPTNGVNKK